MSGALRTVVADPPARTDRVLDVAVDDGPLPDPWPAAQTGPTGCADADAILHRTEHAGIYVGHGRQVSVWSATPELRTAYDFLVYGWALRWLLLQRGRLCLRGTVVVSPTGRTVALVGPSHAGKSTTAVELLRRGWQLGGDDAAEVVPGPGGPGVRCHPRPFHLSRKAIVRAGGSATAGRRVPGTDRFAVTLPTVAGERALDAVVHLDVSKEATSVTGVPLTPAQALVRVAELSWPEAVTAVGPLRASILGWCAEVARGAPAHGIVRPAAGDTVRDVTSAVVDLAAGLPER